MTRQTDQQVDIHSFRDTVLLQEPVELYKVLKFEALVHSGGMAKRVIEAGAVTVNGKVETRKRRKIMTGDVIEFGEHKVRMIKNT